MEEKRVERERESQEAALRRQKELARMQQEREARANEQACSRLAEEGEEGGERCLLSVEVGEGM